MADDLGSSAKDKALAALERVQGVMRQHLVALGSIMRRLLGSRGISVTERVLVGVWRDGFIHAGNLAYMAILALFPFFLVVGALFEALGQDALRAASVHAFLEALPPVVRVVLEPVASDVIGARHGWLVWAGGLVGLWTASSLIETLRDILRRAYATEAPTTTWWRHRLLSSGMIVLAVGLLLAALWLQVAISAVEAEIHGRTLGLPALNFALRLSRAVPAGVLFLSIWMLFVSLTPVCYRKRCCPKWPGALLVTLWWGVVSAVLPVLLRFVFRYSLTYGNLAGVMIALFFFWLVGIGMVTGAELNAALVPLAPERDGGNNEKQCRDRCE